MKKNVVFCNIFKVPEDRAGPNNNYYIETITFNNNNNNNNNNNHYITRTIDLSS